MHSRTKFGAARAARRSPSLAARHVWYPARRRGQDHLVAEQADDVPLPSVVEPATELGRHAAADDGRAGELARIDRLLADIDARRRNLVTNLGLLAPASAGDVRAILATLTDERRGLERERAEVAGWVERRQVDRERLAGIQAWCRRVGVNLERLTYAEKRDALTALAAEARVWKADHAPRYEVTLQLGPTPGPTASLMSGLGYPVVPG